MKRVDLVVHSAAQLVTCAGTRPKRGKALADVGTVANGAVAVSDGRVVAVGHSDEVLARFTAARTIDATGRAVCPGFVDPHSHLVFAGERINEFELRLRGASYMEILDAGGGILSTMQATRAASVDELVGLGMRRLDGMLVLGTTTVEVKTGYGLDTASELKMLRAIEELQRRHPVDLVPTFLGAHTFPPEFAADHAGYERLIVDEMLPQAAAWYATSVFADAGIPFFCDVFCEAGVFDRGASERILKAGQKHGLRAKIHADEFKNLGGVSLACELMAASADHLDQTPDGEIAALAGSDVVGVLLPAVNFNLGSTHYAPARRMADEGVALALATDMNPGSAPCLSMPLTMAIAARYGRMLPAESLNASTINAAWAVGEGDRAGSIEVGKQADLLILSAADYRYLSYEFGSNPVDTVIKAGRIVAKGGRLNESAG